MHTPSRHIGSGGLARILPPLLCLAALLSCPATCSAVYAPGQLCVSLEEGHTVEEVNENWGTTTLFAIPDRNLYLLYIHGIEDLEEFAADMSEDAAVTTAEANYFLRSPEAVRQMVVGAIGGTWDDYQDQELTERIGLDDAHLISQGLGVTVAVLDTGVDPTHQVFEDRLSDDGYDFVDNDSCPWETANGVDDDGDGLTDGGYGHGSMVAGVVALVAPGATILPIRVLNDEGRGDVFQITRGIVHALLHGADVLQMSFGTPLSITTIGWPLAWADSLGVIVVAGAGNEDREEPPYYPAYHDLAFMITALDSSDVKADFADYSHKVLVSAPGVGVRSAYPEDDWGLGSGCSFAAPFVAGEVALIRSLSPLMDRDEIASRLAAAVDPIYGIPGNESYENKLGTGRIYLPRALSAAWVENEVHLLSRMQACPNPSAGTIYFGAPLQSDWKCCIKTRILDVSGRLVRDLPPAVGEPFVWRGRDVNGNLVPSGIYYARLVVGARTRTIPLIVVR